MKKDMIFFGKAGLTSTSANYIANMAKEYVESAKERLEQISFVHKYIQILGGPKTQVNKGIKDLNFISEDLNTITDMYSLIAWLREAIKAKESLLEEINNTTIQEWAKKEGKTIPETPIRMDSITEEDIIANMLVGERNKYLSLQTKCSVMGKFLHPKGAFAEAKVAMKKAINTPIAYTESGRDTIVTSYYPSIIESEVNTCFFDLQKEWRSAQAELNGMKHSITTAIEKDSQEKDSQYIKECTEYNNKVEVINTEFKLWKDTTSSEVSNLKIIIPKHLETVYNIVK